MCRLLVPGPLSHFILVLFDAVEASNPIHLSIVFWWGPYCRDAARGGTLQYSPVADGMPGVRASRSIPQAPLLPEFGIYPIRPQGVNSATAAALVSCQTIQRLLGFFRGPMDWRIQHGDREVGNFPTHWTSLQLAAFWKSSG
jgi:hypothetical protein